VLELGARPGRRHTMILPELSMQEKSLVTRLRQSYELMPKNTLLRPMKMWHQSELARHGDTSGTKASEVLLAPRMRRAGPVLRD
jgi:hypothetical protein